MVARRVPGEARIRWLVILDHGLDPADPRALKTARIGGVTVLTNAQGLTLYWFVPDPRQVHLLRDVRRVLAAAGRQDIVLLPVADAFEVGLRAWARLRTTATGKPDDKALRQGAA